MLIPINNVVRFGVPIASTYYNTETCKLLEDSCCGRNLPSMDYLSCGVDNPNRISTVIGRVSELFVVSYGTKLLILRDSLENASNVQLKKDGSIEFIDGEPQDLSFLFPDRDILYIKSMSLIENSSDGIAEKFLALYKGRLCVIKFSKRDDRELEYERLYYDIGRRLGIPVCECSLSTYSGRKCSLSFLSYNVDKDMFGSLKSLGLTVSELYKDLSDENRRLLDGQLLLDYLMCQQDRHLGNIAVCNDKIYPMYDNGECLGIGSIGYFSNMYRKYIEGCNKDYLMRLLQKASVSECFKSHRDEYEIFCKNYKTLFK
ncbi:MAG: HipA domain-containing protein [Lachnospiraceae bacterium]|nr:HipA domain-containing protein [Lachnospiraceae bacterium]MCI9100477.1 HipA domain-containing protein [Lachnospiraceae bacterium]MCI9358461.1 HipA domain-containing protein [Lachnospiraceae bacterium]